MTKKTFTFIDVLIEIINHAKRGYTESLKIIENFEIPRKSRKTKKNYSMIP